MMDQDPDISIKQRNPIRTIRTAATTIAALAVLAWGAYGAVYMYQDIQADREAQLNIQLNQAKAIGERDMLNRIYAEANARGEVTLANYITTDEGEPQRGRAILLQLVQRQPINDEP